MSLAVLLLMVLSMLRQGTSIASRSSAGGPIAAAWLQGAQPLSTVSWQKYDTLIYSFVATTPSVDELSLQPYDPQSLPQFVSAARSNGVSPHAAIGGWNSGRYFSTNVGSPENRTAFVKTVVDFAKKYDLDGINFDWEFPGQIGVGCNTKNANDTDNFLTFLQELRADPTGSQLVLSAAVVLTTFLDASGKPSTNMTGFSNVLDSIQIMNYDVWGNWSPTVGPNSPLNDTCAAPPNQQGSAVSAVNAWTEAGFSSDKISLGVGAYGYSFNVQTADAFVKGSVTELAAYPKFNASNQPLGDTDTGAPSVDVCGNPEGPSGALTFEGLISHGYLGTDGNPAPGIFYRFDNCSRTAYVYNTTSQVEISFDSAQAFKEKGQFIQDTGLAGFTVWSSGYDYNDILLDAIRDGAGFNSGPGNDRRAKHRIRGKL